ncbi:MAG: hypothetical protein ACI9MX_004155, partial [Candidatus Aldehydirespiratoraceae bacterium]
YAAEMHISVDDFILFYERTIGEMRRAINRCDDNTVNALPPIPEPNSPYQLVNHSLSACAWWTNHIICGHPTNRDRDNEFTSTGTVAALHTQADEVVALLHHLRPELEAATELAGEARTSLPLEEAWTVGKSLIHAYEELAQHLGHLEITVDLVTT